MNPHPFPKLTAEERAIYEWQMWVPGFGEEGQRKLKGASVLISRVGGLGGVVAYQLAAAGVGKLVLAMGGKVKPSDLNRHLQQSHARIGEARLPAVVRRLQELNPRLEIVAVESNVSEGSAAALVAQADVVVDAAPLFEERYALNEAAVAAGKPMVECAMYSLEAHVTTILPHQTPCLRCLNPEPPPDWKRQFPVIGAVSGTVGCLAAVEVIKLLTGLGQSLAGTLLTMDLGTMRFHRLKISRRKDCPICGGR
ncbi:MAG: HesA/MoeB/ThiF family protein [Chthoniobacter sp.]|uniref:HesA/MoeB/ThiF family protein n=1 Tax=Chthoniobacter sp. TaxID=2510640 RepID=UPI0032A33A4F